jgi:hypothetical protein
MKIYRGPRTTDKWKVTDQKPFKEWAEDWQPGNVVHFDGTIDKSGGRHTDLGVEIEVEDIAALHDALQRHQKQYIAELEARVQDLEASVARHSDADKLIGKCLVKITKLIIWHRGEAPSKDVLIDSIQTVSDYALRNRNEIRKEPLKLDWIDFDSI